ncbi:MAG: pantetheine-phosphate adenylyltransferase [Oscillospiraceae bacterium]|nr:pantetheine-phosphate adenylyltransferase [Oscillospiraceae bacterium]
MKAIYAGSFDPFTNGHLDILRDSCDIFEEVHLVIGINAAKKRLYAAEDMAEAIRRMLQRENITNCVVTVYDGLTAKYCAEHNISYLVRGLRNSMDYSYEENIAEVNRLINPNLNSIYLRTKHVGISSSMVRELFSYGERVDMFVPPEIYEVMRRK